MPFSTRSSALSLVFCTVASVCVRAAAPETIGPQSPRDLGSTAGSNAVSIRPAPEYQRMSLCNIHFHESAEHRGGEFTLAAPGGDSAGQAGGFIFAGRLDPAESRPIPRGVCPGDHGDLQVGDTIELHYVFSTDTVQPGPSLAACADAVEPAPALRVEAQVLVLVNDRNAADFRVITAVGNRAGRAVVTGMPASTGTPVEYAGSTTGPEYNDSPSPIAATWAVRPRVLKVDIRSVGAWCESNVFEESHAHGVRKLVVDEGLLSTID